MHGSSTSCGPSILLVCDDSSSILRSGNGTFVGIPCYTSCWLPFDFFQLHLPYPHHPVVHQFATEVMLIFQKGVKLVLIAHNFYEASSTYDPREHHYVCTFYMDDNKF